MFCSERGLGFSGYNNHDNGTAEKPPMATSIEASKPRTDRQLASDVNQNPLKTSHSAGIDNGSAVQRPSSGSRNGRYANTEAHERLDENDSDNRHDTSAQVLLYAPVSDSASIIIFFVGQSGQHNRPPPIFQPHLQPHSIHLFIDGKQPYPEILLLIAVYWIQILKSVHNFPGSDGKIGCTYT